MFERYNNYMTLMVIWN